MSLKDLKKPQLNALAGWFEVELPDKANIDTVRAVLAEKGITPEHMDNYDLVWAQDNFGTDEDADPYVQLLLLVKDGVTAKLYDKFHKSDADKPNVITTDVIAALEADDTTEVPARVAPAVPKQVEQDLTGRVLVKMTRANPRFDIRGYTFTRKAPIQLVTEEDADYICRTTEGFVLALPSEAREYYS